MADLECGNCGHINEAGARYCSSCGAALDGSGEDHTETFTIDEGAMGESVVPTTVTQPLLVVEAGHRAGMTYPLSGPKIAIGRHPDSDIFLDDVTVSRRHVELRAVDSGYEMRDVGSLNGTYLNRERAEEARLSHGDELQIGKFKLVYVLPEDLRVEP